ncbi:MAG: hypothetical protein K2L89_05750 [Muribaculaceae bacterium]|nr:hypothetical protein [Muribaculaceae bacterium]
MEQLFYLLFRPNKPPDDFEAGFEEELPNSDFFWVEEVVLVDDGVDPNKDLFLG